MSQKRRIPLEQPPGEDEALKEWLTRMMILINAAFDQVTNLEPTGQMPDKITDGQIVYFNQVIPPFITAPGPWIVIDGVWNPMFP